MQLSLLLALLIVLSLTWAVLAVLRERGVAVNVRVGHELANRSSEASRRRQTERHNRIVRYYAEGGTPPVPLSVREAVPLEPRPLSEWAQRYVEVRPTGRGETYHYRQSVGRSLAVVPAWFFHAVFASGVVMLAALALVGVLDLTGS